MEEKKENKENGANFYVYSIELITNGLVVSCRRTRPAFVHIEWAIGLSERIVSLGCSSLNVNAKDLIVNQNGNNIATAASFYQFFIDRLIAPAFFERIIIIA